MLIKIHLLFTSNYQFCAIGNMKHEGEYRTKKSDRKQNKEKHNWKWETKEDKNDQWNKERKLTRKKEQKQERNSETKIVPSTCQICSKFILNTYPFALFFNPRAFDAQYHPK